MADGHETSATIIFIHIDCPLLCYLSYLSWLVDVADEADVVGVLMIMIMFAR